MLFPYINESFNGNYEGILGSLVHKKQGFHRWPYWEAFQYRLLLILVKVFNTTEITFSFTG